MFTYKDLIRPKEYRRELGIKFLQVKEDGMRLLISKDWGGRITCVTRDGLTDMWKYLEDTHIGDKVRTWDNDSCIDGEILVPGVQATSVITLLKAHSKDLVFSGFAIPMWAGLKTRHEPFTEDTREALLEHCGATPKVIWLRHRILCTDYVLNTEFWKDKAKEEKIEGYIAKQGHYFGWFKIKPSKTVDCVVIDTTESKSITQFGGLKALTVGVWDGKKFKVIASVGSGFEKDYRMTVKRSSLIGRVCEVEYDSIAAQGMLKFPRFIRWRDDKLGTECTYDQVT